MLVELLAVFVEAPVVLVEALVHMIEPLLDSRSELLHLHHEIIHPVREPSDLLGQRQHLRREQPYTQGLPPPRMLVQHVDQIFYGVDGVGHRSQPTVLRQDQGKRASSGAER